ncbi:DUF4153 domain-containing protein [Paenibacillus sp. YIM B09110]|uniref:DUF4153 domain-containing protein n=1 Tax=Paenibacillus sp. YIM B09110 TaxID=3126102 RepID=UPI00301B804B
MRDPAPWQKKYDRMVVLACVFGLLSQYLFIDTRAGLSMLLVVAAFYGLFFYAVKGRIGGFEKWRGQFSSAWILFVPIGLLTLTYSLFANDIFRVLNRFVLFALIISQTVLLTKSSALPWYRGKFYSELLFLSLIKPFSYVKVPFGLIVSRLKDQEKGDAKHAAFKKVIIGLLLAAPLLIVVITLLASADSIFQSWLNKIPELFQLSSVDELIGRSLYGAVVALYAFCYIWVLLFRKSSGDSKDAPLQAAGAGDRGKIMLDPVTAGTFLLSINAVYLLFVSIQFSYLFGAAGGMLPGGSAYAEYARRGFVELVVVSVINVCLLLGGLHRIRRAGRGAELVRKLSLTSLIGCTLVMLISAYSRLSLYEEAYGYTQVRLLVHGFMIYLTVLCVIAVFRIWKERFSLAKAYIGVSIAAYVLMNYLNIDARIAGNNIERFQQSGIIDMTYLSTLSLDAAPAIYRLEKQHPELEGIDAAVLNWRREASSHGKWQSWSVAIQRAK